MIFDAQIKIQNIPIMRETSLWLFFLKSYFYTYKSNWPTELLRAEKISSSPRPRNPGVHGSENKLTKDAAFMGCAFRIMRILPKKKKKKLIFDGERPAKGYKVISKEPFRFW